VQSGPAPGTIACPRCGSAVGPDQQWCLQCGAPARTRLVPTPNWRAPLLLLAVVATLAGIALAIAFVELTNNNDAAAPVNSQAPPPSATAAQPPAAATTAPPQAPATATGAQPQAPTSTPQAPASTP
jgi:hypothetical protein